MALFFDGTAVPGSDGQLVVGERVIFCHRRVLSCFQTFADMLELIPHIGDDVQRITLPVRGLSADCIACVLANVYAMQFPGLVKVTRADRTAWRQWANGTYDMHAACDYMGLCTAGGATRDVVFQRCGACNMNSATRAAWTLCAECWGKMGAARSFSAELSSSGLDWIERHLLHHEGCYDPVPDSVVASFVSFVQDLPVLYSPVALGPKSSRYTEEFAALTTTLTHRNRLTVAQVDRLVEAAVAQVSAVRAAEAAEAAEAAAGHYDALFNYNLTSDYKLTQCLARGAAMPWAQEPVLQNVLRQYVESLLEAEE